LHFLYTSSDNRARNFCCSAILEHVNRVCLSGTLCGIGCVGPRSTNLTYVAFNFRREITIEITLFPEIAFNILVALYQIARRHVPEVLIFKISILRILCYYMSYDSVCSQHSLFQKRSQIHYENKRAVTFTKCVGLNHIYKIK